MSSQIMMITPTAESVLTNGVIPLTTIARRTGCAITGGTNSVLLNKVGYYKITGTATFTTADNATATIALQKNGVAVPGITASVTSSATDTAVNTLAISGIIRVFCSEAGATLTLINTGIGITTSNVEFDVEYLG